MRKVMRTAFLAQLFCLVVIIFCPSLHAEFLSWGDDTLVTVGEETYTTEDFAGWWKIWKEKDAALPATAEPYIDWLLLAQEAERMMLFDDPTYQRELQIYLKVLSLEQLRHDEVTSQISISDSEVEKKYKELYVPAWLYSAVILKDKDLSERLYNDLQSGKVSLDDLAQVTLSHTKGVPGHPAVNSPEKKIPAALQSYPGLGENVIGVQQKAQKRPVNSDKEWIDVLSGMKKGDFSRPFPWQDNYIIVQLLDIFPGDKDDFKRKKRDIRTRLRKSQAGVLTNDLIGRLWNKYGVEINEKRLQEIDPDSPDEIFSEKPLITIGGTQVFERQVMAMVKKNMQTNARYGFKGMDERAVLHQVVNGIIGQTLITKESLARQYEKNNANIKEIYLFKRRNKLVKMLEKQIRTKNSDVPEEKITAYYQDHLDDFTRPEIYQMMLVKGPEGDLNKVWIDVVVNGKGLADAAQSRLGMKPAEQSYPANHLPSRVRQVADGLTKGDISHVFPVENEFALVKLSGRLPTKTAPLDRVHHAIEKKIAEQQYRTARAAYLKDLKEKIPVKIQQENWEKIKDKLAEQQ